MLREVFKIDKRQLSASERHIEKRVGEYVKAKHGQWIKLTGTKGIPDRMILLPQGKVGFLEMKRPGNKTSAMQDIWLERLRMLGFKATWSDNYEDSVKFVESL